MNGEVLQRKVTVNDPLGLHLRPLAAFAQRAKQFQSTVTVAKNEQRVNGKSPLELMLLAAEQGTELTLEVTVRMPKTPCRSWRRCWRRPGLRNHPNRHCRLKAK